MPSNFHECPEIPDMKPRKKWTIMVFCAGDNELSPIIVSQLKDLKDAGYHPDVNVLVYFDANEKGVPTRLYSINQNGRNCHSRRSHTYVDNLASDNVKIDPRAGPAARTFAEVLQSPFEKEAKVALSAFLNFGQEQYKAEHYVVVLLGHGMIVANDAFLPDQFPDSSITLEELGENLNGFDGTLELLALHSCSMSAVEVAYELKGKANYMIASQGPAYVQGWPYRKLLQRLFEFLNAQNGNVTPPPPPMDGRQLVEGLYWLSSSNGFDFMLSGYSQDLALINLDPDNFTALTDAIEELVVQLKRALTDGTCVSRQLIQLAHLESQSYYNEYYTDLYDFCLCLKRSCQTENLRCLKLACHNVIEVLKPNDSENIDERFSKIVVHSSHFGSLYQHSHGLSVYFPWTEPIGDLKGSVLRRYKKYKFTTDFPKGNSWRSFLKLYLEETKREPRDKVAHHGINSQTFTAFSSAALGVLEGDQKTSGASGPQKTSGASGSCSCISIKNFPTVELTIKGKKCLGQKWH